MDFTKNDYNETAALADLAQKVEAMDAAYVHKISEEMFAHQPFFLSLLLGYKDDISPVELEELMKIYFLVWEYFKPKGLFQKKQITEAEFERIQMQTLQMLHYAEGEPEDSQERIYTDQLRHLKSKALWIAVLLRYDNSPVLLCMEPDKRSMTLIGLYSFIQCFEGK